MVRLTDRPDMTIDVYHGGKTTIQQQQPKLTCSKIIGLQSYRYEGVFFDDNFSYFSLKPYVVTPHLFRCGVTTYVFMQN